MTAHKRLAVLLGIVLAATGCGESESSGNAAAEQVRNDSAANEARSVEADEAALVKLEEDYARALIRKDRVFLENFYADDWRGGNWMGFWTRDTILNAVLNERYVIKSMQVTELKVRVIGDTAIVQGLDEEVTSIDGRDTSGKWAFTDVFQRRDGRWVAVASHTSKIEPTREP